MRIRFSLTFLILMLCFPACITSSVVGEPTPTISLRPSQTVVLASPTVTAIPPSATDTPEVPTATYTNTPEPTALSLPERLSSLGVAFNSNDQLWLWQNDALVFLSETSVNTENYYISTNLVAFSEDGTQIAFTKWDDEVWIIHTDSTGGVVVFDHEQLPNTLWEGGSETRPIQLEWLVDPTRILLDRIIWIDTGLYVTARLLLVVEIESGEINEVLGSDSHAIDFFLPTDN